MKINFLQGVVSGSTTTPFLTLAGNGININAASTPLVVTFTQGTHNYLYIETLNVNNAWTISSNSTYWLYIDINPITGVRTFGETAISPINQFGNVLPTTPLLDQHFFDYSDNRMKVWNGFSWDSVIRVFLGNYSGNTLTPSILGSQVNITGTYDGGYILYNNNNNPLFSTEANNTEKYFITTDEEIHSQNDTLNGYKLSSLVISALAVEPIPLHGCVTWKAPQQLGVASNILPTTPCIGIAANSTPKGGLCQYIIRGFITDPVNWNFTNAPTTPIFVGAQGELTTTIPQHTSIQPIGYVVDASTIFVDIKDIILIENVIAPPSPTPVLVI